MNSKIAFLFLSALTIQNASAEWTSSLQVSAVEVHASGVYILVPVSGLKATSCISTQTYQYIQFSSVNEKLTDRALSSLLFAKATGTKFKAHIDSCHNSYALANSISLD
ncbi:hypothetical protein [Allohahella sp. A8]|uniref:hypothetical protein n=1 Tax=Allohahella sp. A8 TaxID=3141461 RepID=UPI003A8124A0